MANYDFAFNINCSQHPSIPVTHACTLLSCKHNVLLCTQCLLEDLEHAQDHREYMVPMSHFSSRFYKNIQEIKTKLKPFHEILKCKDDHLTYYTKFIRSQKASIEKEMNILQEQLNFFLDKLKMASFKELDENQKYLSREYEKLEECFSIPELKFINVQNENELSDKISNFPKNKVESFLMSLRSKISNLIDPESHSVFGNVNNICSEIQNFRKQETSPLSFSSVSNQYLKPFFSEVETIVSNFVNSLSKIPEDFKQTRNNISQQSEQGLFEVKSGYSKKEIKRDLPLEQPKLAKREEDDPFSNSSPLNVLVQIPKSLLLSSKSISKSSVPNFVSSLDLDSRAAGIAFIPLEKDLVLGSGSNGELVIGKVEKNGRTIPVVSFRVGNVEASFITMTKLTPQGTDGIYFAAGNHQGNIYIWRAESVIGPGSDSKPMAALMSEGESGVVTALSDLKNGSHLISGTSKGSVMLWDYMMGSLVKKYHAHNAPINSFSLYNSNNNFASSSPDGTIIFWSISRDSKTNDFENVSLSITKKLPMDIPITCLGSLVTFEQGLLVCDSNGGITLLDNVKYRVRANIDVGEEGILDLISIEGNCGGSKEKEGIILGVTRRRIIVIDIKSFEIVKVINDANSDISIHLSEKSISSHKINIINCSSNQIVFAILDQRPNTNSILHTLSLMM